MSNEKAVNIAVIVAGIDEEYQSNIISGINEFTKNNNVNTSYFAAFGGVLASTRYDTGEYNIYNLINYSKFDGAILMTNTVCAPGEKEKIIGKVRSSGTPAVVFDCSDYPDFYNISIDNSGAMKAVVRHVIEEHNAKTINFISGPLSNPEARERYEAFLSVMEEYGLAAEESRIFFGEFRGIDGKRAIDKFVSSGDSMPDAVICANDAMALTAVSALENYGYSVPDDVIVTGFDNTYNASHHCPALTTVNRPLFDAGFKACELLCNIVKGIPCEKNTVLEAAPVFSESCGCFSGNNSDEKTYKKSTYRLIESCRSDISLLNRMTSTLAETETTDEIINILSQSLNEMDCDRFCLCLCSEWQGAFRKSSPGIPADDFQITGYTKTMGAPLIWDKGSVRSVESFSSADMFPEEFENGGNISYFLPLHFRERCLGYYIIMNGDFPIKSMLCHSMMMNISNSIENVRKLLHLNNAINELDKLYVIDPLCNIYNRNGFIRVADGIFKESASKRSKVMITFIDMDGLKFINDNYGHNEGDFALQRLARVIQDSCTGRHICARFGGDEFIIFGADMDEDDVQALERRFEARIAEMNRIINKPYELSASIGTCLTEAGPDTLLFKLITMADEKMYEQKKRKKTSRYLRRS